MLCIRNYSIIKPSTPAILHTVMSTRYPQNIQLDQSRSHPDANSSAGLWSLVFVVLPTPVPFLSFHSIPSFDLSQQHLDAQSVSCVHVPRVSLKNVSISLFPTLISFLFLLATNAMFLVIALSISFFTFSSRNFLFISLSSPSLSTHVNRRCMEVFSYTARYLRRCDHTEPHR